VKKPKKKWVKPKMTVKKLTPFFFACLNSAARCTTVVANKTAGGGCPLA